MNKKVVEFESVEKTDFLIDDDLEMKWISGFDSNNFDRFFVFIDSNVDKIWGEFIFAALKKHKKEIFIFKIEPQEKSKSLSFYPEAIFFLENNTATRYDLVLAVGGGIVIDLVSFTVSTYMRGLPFYAIPTTLIGQVDATTAGKTCLNTEKCKNLLGTFYYPLVVYNNINFLKTNSDRYIRQGFSEVFKYGLLASRHLIDLLDKYSLSRNQEVLIDIINLTIEKRIAIRKKDALASNLGHTFGHAIEKLSSSSILHGDAISIGTIMALSFGEQEGLTHLGLKEDVVRMMKGIGLNIYIDSSFSAEKIVHLMEKDKKSSSKLLNLVLLKDIEIPYSHEDFQFYSVNSIRVKEFLENFIECYEYRITNLSDFLEKENLCNGVNTSDNEYKSF